MPELLSQALDLVFYGMGTVFVFLTVLVALTKLMSFLLGVESPIYSGRNEQTLVDGKIDGEIDTKLVAVISAAIKRHRDNKE